MTSLRIPPTRMPRMPSFQPRITPLASWNETAGPAAGGGFLSARRASPPGPAVVRFLPHPHRRLRMLTLLAAPLFAVSAAGGARPDDKPEKILQDAGQALKEKDYKKAAGLARE